MESVLKGFRCVAEERDRMEKKRLTAIACRAAFNGDEKVFMKRIFFFFFFFFFFCFCSVVLRG